MPEVLLARNLAYPSDIVGDDPVLLEAFRTANGLRPNDLICPGQAYTVHYASPQTSAVIRKLNALPQRDRMSLARAAEELGDDLHQLALFIKENLTSVVGASSTAAVTRLNGFQRTLVEYQQAVIRLSTVDRTHGPGIGHRRNQAETKVRTAYNALSKAYRTELNRLAPEAYRNKNRGNALSNADRAIVLAQRNANGKPDIRLNVADVAEARKMGSLAKYLNKIGRLAIGVEAGLRVHKVNSTRQDGGDWLREGAVQMTGFGAGGAVGGLAGKYTIIGGSTLAAKAGLVLSGPAGWVVLGVIVGAGVVAGVGVGYYADKFGKFTASSIWDWDREWNWSWD